MPPITSRLRTGLLAGFLLSYPATLLATPPVIDDQKIIKNLQTEMEKFAGTDGIPSADDLRTSAKEADHRRIEIQPPAAPPVSRDLSYNELSRSVYLISSIYKCGKCDRWHQGSAATAWCLGEDGLMVTNAHVFTGTKGGTMGVTDRDGNCYPVTGLLGIDVASDVAVFRVKASGLRALRMGSAADVGSPVTVISNPVGNLFFRTSGSVARYSLGPKADKKKPTTIMAITADYALGSSGGPVFNAAGEVVGMVSSTRSIYTGGIGAKKGEAPKGHLQMVIKSCVPVDSIRSLFDASGPAESANAD